MSAALALLLAAAASASSWGPKDWGVLIVGASGGKPAAALKESLGKKFPVELAAGLADGRELQRGVDRLTKQRVRKLVVVPLELATQTDAMEQTKYLLGMRKEPSAEYFKLGRNRSGYTKVKRVQTKLPVVMSSAFDDHPVLGAILAARAAELSSKPERETVFLVGRGSPSDADDELARRHLASLGRIVRESGGFKAVEAHTLRDEAPEKVRAPAESALRKAVSAASREGRVIVVPHLLGSEGLERRIQKVLDGSFYAWNGKPILPDARVADWVEAKAREAAAMPDMRRHKDEGRSIPGPEQKRLLQVERQGPVPSVGPRHSKPAPEPQKPQEPVLTEDPSQPREEPKPTDSGEEE